MINKIEEDKTISNQKVCNLIVAKICLNVALIRTELGDFVEAVFMHERSLSFKSQTLPSLSEEIRDQNILLAFA